MYWKRDSCFFSLVFPLLNKNGEPFSLLVHTDANGDRIITWARKYTKLTEGPGHMFTRIAESVA